MKKIKLIIVIFAAILIHSCASMKTPEGGPKDTAPPKVLKMEPKDLTTNFQSKKITIEFNEYIKLANEFKEFSISPEQERPPILKGKLKRLEIELQDTLEKNTTYTLNFGKSITDITEGNAIKNFTYVFSTGSTLDSISVSGNVRNSLTGQPELDAVVMLIPLARDSIFGKKRASIYATTDSSGNYKLSNLKKGTYKVYAIKENTGGDKIYQQFTDEVGFINEPIQLSKNLDSVNMLIFKELAPTFNVIDRKLNQDGSISMSFNQKLRQPEITIIEPTDLDQGKKVQFTKTNDSVKLWLNNLSFDSVKVAIKDEGKPLDTIKFTRSKRDTYTRNVTADDNLEGSLLNPNKTLRLTFNLPLTKIDVNQILLLEDSIPRKGFTLEKDSTDLLSYNFKYRWKPNEPYIIKFNDNAVTAIFDAKNKEFSKTFQLAKAEDYGTILVKITVPDTSKNYILEILNEQKDRVVSSQQVTKNTTLTFSNYRVGTYYIRIVYDENKNGIWDTGNVKKGLQPEKTWLMPGNIRIRANWDQDFPVKIP